MILLNIKILNLLLTMMYDLNKFLRKLLVLFLLIPISFKSHAVIESIITGLLSSLINGITNNSSSNVGDGIESLFNKYNNNDLKNLNVTNSNFAELIKLPGLLRECEGNFVNNKNLSLISKWHECEGYVLYSNGDRFVGKFLNGNISKGTVFFLEKNSKNYGDIFVGSFIDGNVDEGTYYYNASIHKENIGDSWTGKMTSGLREGYGEYKFSDGRVWAGEFTENNWISGKKYAANEYRKLKKNNTKSNKNNNFIVSCKNSPFTGEDPPDNWNNCKGKLMHFDDDTKIVAEGVWRKDNIYLNGKITWSSDDPDIDGLVMSGKINEYLGFIGNGTFSFITGPNKNFKYEGEVKDGMKKSYGKTTFVDGSTYEGKYENNLMNGWGIYNYKKGDKFIGNFKNDDLHDGDYYYANGDHFQGSFKNGRPYNGKITYQNGVKNSLIEGKYKNPPIKNKEYANTYNENKNDVLNKNIVDKIPPVFLSIKSDVLSNNMANVSGTLFDDSKIAVLNLDGTEIPINSNGKFSVEIYIPPGGLKSKLEAIDQFGNKSEEIIQISREYKEVDDKIYFSKLNPTNITGKKNTERIALIIGIEKYERTSDAPFAEKDAMYFLDYAKNILGIPENKIKYLTNSKAKRTEIKLAYKQWLSGRIDKNTEVILFFAGHGLATPDGKKLFLMPYDGETSLLDDTAILLSEIFEVLKGTNPKSVIALIDACYSGQTRNNETLIADARPITIVPIKNQIPDNFIVLSASSGSELSGSLPEAEQGLFSYYLMKGLEGDADKNNDKIITVGELFNFVQSNVTRQAIRLGREQTPELQGNENKILVEFK